MAAIVSFGGHLLTRTPFGKQNKRQQHATVQGLLERIEAGVRSAVNHGKWDEKTGHWICKDDEEFKLKNQLEELFKMNETQEGKKLSIIAGLGSS